MAGPPTNFASYLETKYGASNAEEAARTRQIQTQTKLLPEQTAVENAMRRAQTTGIGLTNTGLEQDLSPASDIMRSAVYRGLTGSFGSGFGGLTGGPPLGGGTAQPNAHIINVDPNMTSASNGAPGADVAQGFARGTADATRNGSGRPIPAAHGPSKGATGGKGAPPKGHAAAAATRHQMGKTAGKPPAPKALGKVAGGPAGHQAMLSSLMAMMGGGALGPQAPSQPAGPSVAPGALAPTMGFFGGTAQVPGRGTGNVDKVPAMLAPHEAVLTHGAADALGRNKIAKLNAMHPPRGLVKRQPRG